MHIAIEASEATATRFLSALESSLDRVLLFPEAGAPRDHFAARLRAAFHGRYVIYYRADETELVRISIAPRRNGKLSGISRHQCRLKYWTARSCLSAAARDLNVPRLRRLPVLGSVLRE